MKEREVRADDLIGEALQNDGMVTLGSLVQSLVSLDEMRDIARRFGLSARGFRIDRAPKKLLTQLLTDSNNTEVLEEVCTVVARKLERVRDDAAPRDREASATVPASILRLREQELQRARAALDRSQAQAARQRDKEAGLTRRLRQEEERNARLRSEIDELRRRVASLPAGDAVPADHAHRIHQLERDLEAFAEAEEGLRRLLALRAARIRDCESQVLDLQARVPKGRRPKAPPPPEPPLREEFRVPHFPASFYRSLEGKGRRSVEKAMQAILLFCTEGPGYPGLEVKLIEGQDLWSLRASLKLRVYFRFRDDHDVDFVAVADREDQHTTLRRLKER